MTRRRAGHRTAGGEALRAAARAPALAARGNPLDDA
jgi:hypothetical protein